MFLNSYGCIFALMGDIKKHKAEILLAKYGDEVFNKAIEYFCENGMHCTIEEFEKKLEEISNNQNKTI